MNDVLPFAHHQVAFFFVVLGNIRDEEIFPNKTSTS
jgi:hypothetical protein